MSNEQWTWQPLSGDDEGVPYYVEGGKEYGGTMISCEWQQSPFTDGIEQVLTTHPVWEEGQHITLPTGYAVCRRVPGVSVPVEAIRTLREYGIPLGMTYAKWHKACQEVQRWLDAQAKQDSAHD